MDLSLPLLSYLHLKRALMVNCADVAAALIEEKRVKHIRAYRAAVDPSHHPRVD
jgi:hypothetical protein